MKSPFGVCVDNSEHPASLEVHKVYRVIPDQEAEQDWDVRIVDESGEDYLYPENYFVAGDLPQETERALMDSFDRIQLVL